jgi:hypothetical protein
MNRPSKEPLSPQQKVKVVQAGERSLRDMGDELEVHHSTIKTVREEGADVLSRHWQEKSTRVGRPRKDEGADCEEVDRLKVEAKQAEEELAVRQMRIDWLELKLKWSEEELREAKVRRQKQLKKKLKKK